VRLARPVRLFVEYSHEIHDYLGRQARSLDGERLETNPPLEYVYRTFRTNLRVRPVRSWTLNASWTHRERDDVYLHYNDYTQDSLRIRSTVRTGKLYCRLSLKYWERDFVRAFIFDNILTPERES
jgi:hypothetical protein